MRKDQRNLLASIALAGSALASMATPAAAAGLTATSTSFMKYDMQSILISGAALHKVDTTSVFQKANGFYKF